MQVIHFDLKCDNFLVDPIRVGMTDTEFWESTVPCPTAAVAVTDFGTSHVFRDDQDEHVYKNLGTEFIMSPEMILIARSRYTGGDSYDRRKKSGAGRASDVWSLGCLLYEIITGEMLFFDPIYPAFFCRVTQDSQPILTDENKALLGHNSKVIDMLKFMLVRDAQLRPSIRAVQQRFSSLFREQISRVGTLAANMMADPSGAASARPSTRCEEFADRALALCQPANRWFESFCTRAPQMIVPGMSVWALPQFMSSKCLSELSSTTHILLMVDHETGMSALRQHADTCRAVTHIIPDVPCDAVSSLKEGAQFVQQAIAEGGSVLVLCRDGCTWAPAIGVAYLLMGSSGYSMFDAYKITQQQFMAFRPPPYLVGAMFDLLKQC